MRVREIVPPSGAGPVLGRTMKTVLLAACLTLVAAEAQAISRYDATRMSCGKVQATIAREGAVILRYQSTRVPGLPLYDRYVQSQQFCNMGEVRKRAMCRAPIRNPARSTSASGWIDRFRRASRTMQAVRQADPRTAFADSARLSRTRTTLAPAAAGRRARPPSPASFPWWPSRPAPKSRRSCRRRQECGGKG